MILNSSSTSSPSPLPGEEFLHVAGVIQRHLPPLIAMKQVWKIGTIFSAVVALWISLLLTNDLPQSLHLIVPYFPMYALASLGCYGLGALGYGMMVFRVCPEEADLLQKDIAEAQTFFKEHGVDLSSD